MCFSLLKREIWLLTWFQSKIHPWIVWKVNMSVFFVLGRFENECESVIGDFTLGSWPFACKGALLFRWLMGTSANAGMLGCLQIRIHYLLKPKVQYGKCRFWKEFSLVWESVHPFLDLFWWISGEKSLPHKWLYTNNKLKSDPCLIPFNKNLLDGLKIKMWK